MTEPTSSSLPLSTTEHDADPGVTNTNNNSAPCCPAAGGLGYTPMNPDEPLLGDRYHIPTADIPLYITGEPLATCTRIILLFTDVFGIDSGHHQHVADRLAHHELFTKHNSHDEKVCVVIPDLFRGHPILQPWTEGPAGTGQELLGNVLGAPGMVYRLKRYYAPDIIDTMVYDMVLPYLEAQTEQNVNHIKVSCVGFCFGAWVTGVVLGHSSHANHNTGYRRLTLDCGVGIHPSFQPQLVHGGTARQVALRLNHPMLLLPSGMHDTDMCPSSTVVSTMLTVYQKKLHLQDEFTCDQDVSIPFPTMPHGWVTRGNVHDPETAAEQARALTLTVEFILKWSK